MTMREDEEEVRFQIGGVMLAGTLAMPDRAHWGLCFSRTAVGAAGTVRATASSPRRCARPDSAHCFLTCSPETKRPKI